METIKFTEQDIINAICEYIAEKKHVYPADVWTELLYDEGHFSAEVEVHGRSQVLIQANLIEALRLSLERQNIDPYAARLQLVFDEYEGIIALATYR